MTLEMDLPEPRRMPLTETERRARQWRLLSTGLYAVIAYALVHKVLVPLFLKLTPLAATPYARVDVWFVHCVLLAFFLSEKRRDSPVLPLLAGMGIVYGVWELYELSEGRLVGWLAISRVISSVPIAVGSAFLLGSPSLRRSGAWAWAGALVLLAALVTAEWLGRRHGL